MRARSDSVVGAIRALLADGDPIDDETAQSLGYCSRASLLTQLRHWDAALCDVVVEQHRASRREAVIEDLEDLIRAGESVRSAAARVGYERPESLSRVLYRWRHPDLARIVWAAR